MPLRCFIQTQAPVPGTAAQAVRYPACEWVSDDGTVDHWHPLNRWVCHWLTHDMAEVSRCDEGLQALTQVAEGARPEWFIDGDACCVQVQAHGVQFNSSHVGPEDTAYWNQPEARFALAQVQAWLREWRAYLVASAMG